MNLLSAACVILGLYLAFAAGLICSSNRFRRPVGALTVPASRFPLATLLLVVAVAVPSTLQFFFPAILWMLQRDYARFLSGEWWRVITPLFVQDGGISGSIFNLVSLLLLGGVAERLWGSGRMIALFFVGGLVGEIVAFAWQPIGAGNSLGNFSLAASVAVTCLAPQARGIARVTALLALGADAVLAALKDIHGAAALAGVILAVTLRRFRPEQNYCRADPEDS